MAFLLPPPLQHRRASPRLLPGPARPNHARQTRNRRATVHARARSGASSRVIGEPHTPEQLGFLHVATVTGPHGVRGAVKASSASDFAAHRLSPTSSAQRFLLLPGRRYPRPVDILAAAPASREHVWIIKLGDIAHRPAPSAPEHVDSMRLRGARIFVRADERPPLARGEFVAADLPGLRVSLRNKKLEPALADADAAGAGAANNHTSSDGTGTGAATATGAAARPAAEIGTATAGAGEKDAYYVARRRRAPPLAAGVPIGVVTCVHTAADVCAAAGAGKGAAKVGNDLLEVALFEHDDLRVEAPFAGDVPDEATRVLVPFVRQIVPVVDRAASLLVLDPPAGLLDATVVNRAERARPPRGLLMAARTEG